MDGLVRAARRAGEADAGNPLTPSLAESFSAAEDALTYLSPAGFSTAEQ